MYVIPKEKVTVNTVLDGVVILNDKKMYRMGIRYVGRNPGIPVEDFYELNTSEVKKILRELNKQYDFEVDYVVEM